MNRLVLDDSNLSLDAESGQCESSLMKNSPLVSTQVHLRRVDARKNMARFYHLALEATLFGSPVVVSRWGRLGTFGRMKTEVVGSEREGLALLLKILRSKRARGYIPVSSPILL